MSKRYKRPPVDLLDFLDRKEVEGSIPLKVGERTFYVKPPELLADADFANVEKMESGEGGDTLAMVRAMVDDYDGLCQALAEAGHPGGAAAAVMAAITEASDQLEEEQGASPGESGASSTS